MLIQWLYIGLVVVFIIVAIVTFVRIARNGRHK